MTAPHAPNPYAPPRDDAALPPAASFPRAPLPEGIRRHGLDPAKLRDMLDRQWRAVVVRLVIVLALYLAAQVALDVASVESLVITVPVLGAYVVAGALFRRWRIRRTEARLIQGYELLVSPRVLRRTAHRLAPSEILAPEVTSIVEVPQGLSIEARGVKHRLFVTRAVAGYEEVRDHVARWAPIETRIGLAAFVRRFQHRFGERTRDAVSDPSLSDELAAVRALAMPFDRRGLVRPGRRLLVLAALWVLLFAALWWVFTAVPRRAPPLE